MDKNNEINMQPQIGQANMSRLQTSNLTNTTNIMSALGNRDGKRGKSVTSNHTKQAPLLMTRQSMGRQSNMDTSKLSDKNGEVSMRSRQVF